MRSDPAHIIGGDNIMAKRFDKKKDDNKLERAIRRNWIIMGVTLVVIIVLFVIASRGGA